MNKFQKWMARLRFEMKMVWNNIHYLGLFFGSLKWIRSGVLGNYRDVDDSGGGSRWCSSSSCSVDARWQHIFTKRRGRASIHGSVFGETTSDQWKDNKSFAELTAVSTPSARLVRLSPSLRHLLPLAWTRQPSPITDLSRRSFLVLLFFNFKAALP